MTLYRGYYEAFEEVEAESEEEAKKKLAAKIAAVLSEEGAYVVCWEIPEEHGRKA